MSTWVTEEIIEQCAQQYDFFTSSASEMNQVMYFICPARSSFHNHAPLLVYNGSQFDNFHSAQRHSVTAVSKDWYYSTTTAPHIGTTFITWDGYTYLIFVADAADIVRGEFSCHVEKLYQMWTYFRCGDILDVEIFLI